MTVGTGHSLSPPFSSWHRAGTPSLFLPPPFLPPETLPEKKVRSHVFPISSAHAGEEGGKTLLDRELYARIPNPARRGRCSRTSTSLCALSPSRSVPFQLTPPLLLLLLFCHLRLFPAPPKCIQSLPPTIEKRRALTLYTILAATPPPPPYPSPTPEENFPIPSPPSVLFGNLSGRGLILGMEWRPPHALLRLPRGGGMGGLVGKPLTGKDEVRRRELQISREQIFNQRRLNPLPKREQEHTLFNDLRRKLAKRTG